jgi:hypothetical protein
MSGPDQTLHALERELRASLKSQYHAALAMLKESIERCPEETWYDEAPKNACWQLAYHTLYFTHLYLQPDESAFRPWEGHQRDVQHPDGIPGPANPDSTLPLIPTPYSKDEVLTYWELCDRMVDGAVETLDFGRKDSGFYWYPIPKLEHQIVNVRHVQHHAAQLADRVRAAAGVGVRWAGSRRPK